jgi:hypothetical protein
MQEVSWIKRVALIKHWSRWIEDTVEFNSELKMHQICDADVKKNCNYSHSFTPRIKIMASSW